MSGKMKFKVLRPVGLSGRKERGEIVELSLEDAKNVGGEYLKAVNVDGFGRVTDNDEVTLDKVEPEKKKQADTSNVVSAYKEEEKTEPAPETTSPGSEDEAGEGKE